MNKEKTCDEMDFNEFNRWACEYVITEFLENGIKGIKSGMHMVLLQVAQNKEFGGGKSDKKNKKD